MINDILHASYFEYALIALVLYAFSYTVYKLSRPLVTKHVPPVTTRFVFTRQGNIYSITLDDISLVPFATKILNAQRYTEVYVKFLYGECTCRPYDIIIEEMNGTLWQVSAKTVESLTLLLGLGLLYAPIQPIPGAIIPTFELIKIINTQISNYDEQDVN